jgi:hypothetical protein
MPDLSFCIEKKDARCPIHPKLCNEIGVSLEVNLDGDVAVGQECRDPIVRVCDSIQLLAPPSRWGEEIHKQRLDCPF